MRNINLSGRRLDNDADQWVAGEQIDSRLGLVLAEFRPDFGDFLGPPRPDLVGMVRLVKLKKSDVLRAALVVQYPLAEPLLAGYPSGLMDRLRVDAKVQAEELYEELLECLGNFCGYRLGYVEAVQRLREHLDQFMSDLDETL